MKLLPSEHPVIEVAGTARACGRQYGEAQREAMDAFLYMEVTPNPERLRYAAQCWKHLERWVPGVADFSRGMAEGAGMTLPEATLLLLHEEIEHTKHHCTALAATGAATRGGAPIVGQNWDWLAHLYAWSRVTRVSARGAPKVLTYGYPGLWAGAGINEHGLCLGWTSGGLAPRLAPKVGVPSYAIIAGVLAQRTCAEAVALVKRTRNAGCFIFLIADATGAAWVIEGMPGAVVCEPCDAMLVRAVYYQTERMKVLAGQDDKGMLQNPKFRGIRLTTRAQRHYGRIDGRVMELLLRDAHNRTTRSVCCRPKGDFRWMSLDSLYFLPKRREMHVARGLPDRHVYKRYGV